MKDPAPNPFSKEVLPQDMLESWQNMLNLAAELLGVPAGLITRIDGREIEIFLASKAKENPYAAGYKTRFPESGFYCEWVAQNRQTMLIPDARHDPLWKTNDAVQLGMVSYLGSPIMRPDGVVFGTICFLDSKENAHNGIIVRLVNEFKRMVELSLSSFFAGEEIRRKDRLLDDLSRVFPICAYCKRVCNDELEWVPVENYIKNLSGRRASHGVCPQCYDKELRKDDAEAGRNRFPSFP